jgi:methyltransferase (TIGR00027 family)
VDHLALRARAIDRALEAGLATGIDQVVILGAGLDTRAHRLAALAHATVFEVDHPSSQAHKRARATRVPQSARRLVYVPVDFARDSLAEQLQAHGHAAQRATFWIWEGVVPYLELGAIRATLAAVAQRSVPGSRLATTYATPSLVWMRRARAAISLGMRALGEPVRTLLEPSEWRGLSFEAGFELLEDSGTRDWREKLADRRRAGVHIEYERLAVALRR